MKRILLLLFSLLMILACKEDNNQNNDNQDSEDANRCEINWTKSQGNPLMLPGSAEEWDNIFMYPGSVIFHDDLYHMWYTGGGSPDTIPMIGHATSPDGITWTKDPNNPVLQLGPDGSWDDSRVHGPSVLIVNSQYHMWYSGCPNPRGIYPSTRIGHATSADGATWTKDPNNPVLDLGPDGSFDDTWISGPSVLNDGKEYHMWYSGDGGWGTFVQFGHATSADGINWTRDMKNPVLSCYSVGWEYDRADYAKVVFDGTTYHMWYSGGRNLEWQIGYARSDDGSTWKKSKYNPVMSIGSPGDWDDSFVASSAIMMSGDRYSMWYAGANKDEWEVCIGFAESDICMPGE